MHEVNSLPHILNALTTDQLNEAQEWIDKEKKCHPPTAHLFYLEGKLHMKRSNWGEAISCFLKAEEMEPDGPSKQCLLMLNDIMAFYNKDMYNQ